MPEGRWVINCYGLQQNTTSLLVVASRDRDVPVRTEHLWSLSQFILIKAFVLLVYIGKHSGFVLLDRDMGTSQLLESILQKFNIGVPSIHEECVPGPCADTQNCGYKICGYEGPPCTLKNNFLNLGLICSCFSEYSNGGDGMFATSSNGSQYSGSRVETPVSYAGDDDDDDDDDFNENDDDDWNFWVVDFLKC